MIELNTSDFLQVNWLHAISILIVGVLSSFTSLAININIAQVLLILTMGLILIEPLNSIIKLIAYKTIVGKLMKIVKAEKLQDFTVSSNHCYITNGVIIDVLENRKMYRLDFHANGITHSDNIYHLDDRITESFESMIIDKKRHSWGMSYYVAK